MLSLRTKPRINVCFWSGAKRNVYHTTKTWLRETLSGLRQVDYIFTFVGTGQSTVVLEEDYLGSRPTGGRIEME